MSEHPKPAHAATSLPALSRASFMDADEQAAALSGWNQHYLQLSRGAFCGEMRRLELGGVRLFIENLQKSVYQTGFIGSEGLAVGIPLQLHGETVFCGQACDANSLHVFSGASGFEFRSSRDHVMLGLELDEASCHVLRGPDEAGAAGFGVHAGIHVPDAAAFTELKQFLSGLFDAVEAMPSLLSAGAVRAGLFDTLLDKLDPVMAGTASVPGPKPMAMPRGSSHWRTVQQARELVQAQLDQPPTVTQLCSRLGVSRRTLQNCFQTVLGLSPLAYLRAVRLNAARQELKTATSVTAAATQLGFWHFGHFAHDYRQMFGELPSDTFRRHH
ncbi:helix-turn-helix domain-containing protein [Polaromonas sp. OV174]|uniref:helix-turn-helix domain-containing protein n=1 Tax=Polaromonas sp. OV174 TaxID=1855300 RepID=UPI0011609945|nr:helix-turn-helix domain-containing protein [Polaromonas sp. OV174]